MAFQEAALAVRLQPTGLAVFPAGRSGTVYPLSGRICQDDAWMPGILGRYSKGPGDMQAAEEEYLKVLFILEEKYFLQKSWMERLRENLGNTA